MSEELRDEVEAINSIYGEGTLVPSEASVYILTLPGDGDATSLKICFPEAYPAQAPEVLGVQHSGGRRGVGAHDLCVFRECVGAVFHGGEVCLFDALEEYARRSPTETPDPEAQTSVDDEGGENKEEEEEEDFATMAAPEWFLSDPVTESKSTFVARVARVSSAQQADLYVRHLLWSERKVREATHNVTAWRGDGFQDCDDDGETAAGGRLLRLMQAMGVGGAVVVVTRWFGGVKLGPRRFALMNGVAREGLVRAGF